MLPGEIILFQKKKTYDPNFFLELNVIKINSLVNQEENNWNFV